MEGHDPASGHDMSKILPIALSLVEGGDESGLFQTVHIIIYTWKQVHVKGGYGIELPEVIAKPDRPIRLGYHHQWLVDYSMMPYLSMLSIQH